MTHTNTPKTVPLRPPLDPSRETYHVACVATEAQLAALQSDWNRLAGDHAFLSWDWCACWWRHYRTPHAKPWIVTVRDQQGRLVGLAPWLLRQTLTQGRVIRFLGANEVCGDRLTILSEPAARAAVTQAIAHWLAVNAADQWDLLELIGVEQGDAALTALITLLQTHGHGVHTRPGLNCWRVELPETWEDFLKMLSKQRRTRIRKMLRDKLDAGLATHTHVRTEEELATSFERLIDLHQKRRNVLGEPGCFASDTFVAFHAEYARCLLEQNKLYLSTTTLAGVPAAMGYDFMFGDTMYHYQSGFEPALADERPGWLNLAATLRWAIERGIKRFDMLRGDESYKASFAATPTPLVEIRVAGKRASAMLLHAAWRTQAGVKKLVRQGINQAANWNRQAKPIPPMDVEVALSPTN